MVIIKSFNIPGHGILHHVTKCSQPFPFVYANANPSRIIAVTKPDIAGLLPCYDSD